ncbi:MAG: hypothetical protein HKN41_01970 [Ilumatobacter sp.]|nr:hypothetical protein [Ilumatobacter sp.]
MTIRKGEPWGEPVERPDDLIRFDSDAGLASALAADPMGAFGVAAGDLHTALGGPPDRREMQRLPVDAMRVVTDRAEMHAIAHVVARRSWWRGPILVVANVGHIGDWNVASRAHPNDGRLDVVTVEPAMTMRQRWEARRRLPAGTHVPHPHIAVRSATTVEEVFERPMKITVDGRDVGHSRLLRVDVLPDAHVVLV